MAHFRNCGLATDFKLAESRSSGWQQATAFVPIPYQLVDHVHEDRGDGRDPGHVAGRGDVPGGPERDRKNLCGSDQPPRDGLRNRPAHWDALPQFPTGPSPVDPSRVCAVLNFRRGPWSFAKLAGPLIKRVHTLLNRADHPNR